jgi:shikimate kinase/shikimate 5-dehydrogenase/3-dehydroquinate dehydratase
MLIISVSDKSFLKELPLISGFTFELRLDLLDIKLDNLKDILELNQDYIITFRENGSLRDKYFELANQYENCIFDFDIETDQYYIKKFSASKKIVSYHNYLKTPNKDELNYLISYIKAYKPYYIKIATKINSFSDLVTGKDLLTNYSDLAFIPMGKGVEYARIDYVKLGSPLNYFSSDSNNKTAEGQISYIKHDIFRKNNLKNLKKYCVFGNPISHSLSPNLFNQLGFEDSKYTRILAKDSSEIEYYVTKFNLSGFNITSPFKKDNFLNSESAINTGYLENGNYNYSNTDVLALKSILEKYQDDYKQILIIGAGGASEAAIEACKEPGFEVTIVNRTEEKALRLSKENNLHFYNYNSLQDAINNTEIIISCVPKIDTNVDLTNKIIIDAIYKESPIESSINPSVEYTSGLKWLIKQAEFAFEKFTGKLKSLSDPKVKNYKSISLIGFMGSGKSTITRELSEKLDIELFDLDDEIEKQEKRKITSIFSKYGEKYFREIESNMMLKENFNKSSMIYSLGGGFCDSLENQLLLNDSFVIYLHSDFSDCFDRIKDDLNRPQLNKTKHEIEKLYNLRLNSYFYFSDMIIKNDNIQETVNILTNEIKRLGIF